ncbi:MAG: oligosaccharide flippase family protein [Desulfobacter sp.]|nr:MAG: oligosaccharide flippase family protein [Desulfobacter sp.]
MSFFKKTAQFFSLSLVASAISLLNSILAVRILGPNQYGAYVILFILPNLFSSLGSFGLGPSLIFHLNKKKIPMTPLLGVGALFGFTIGMLYYSGSVLFIDFFSAFVLNDKVDQSLLCISLLSVPFILMQNNLLSLVQGTYRMSAYGILSEIFPASVRFILIIILLYCFDGNILSMVCLTIATHMLSTASCIGFLLKSIEGGLSIRALLPNWEICRSLFSFGGKGYMGAVIQKANQSVVKLILTSFFSVDVVGCYALAENFANYSAMLIRKITISFMPKVSMSTEGEVKNFLPLLISSTTIYMIITGSACATLVTPFVNLMYGEAFASVIPLTWVLLPGAMFLSYIRICNVTFTHTGRPLIKTFIRSIGFVINLLLILVFIHSQGVSGVALAYSTSNFAMAVMATLLLKYYFELSPYQLFIIKQETILLIGNNMKALFFKLRQTVQRNIIRK